MSFSDELYSLLEKPDEAGQLAFKKNPSHSTGEGDRYEEAVLALVLLRGLRRRLRFALSANDDDASAFDDLVLRWKSRDSDGASAGMLVQLKHKTSKRHTTIDRASLMAPKYSKSKDFSIELYYESYKKIIESLEGGNYTLVLSTNLDLDTDAQNMFVPGNPKSVPGMERLDSGGRLYSLNPDDDYIKCLVPDDDRFIQHFYLFCNQSSNKSIRKMIYKELKLTLGADDSCCKRMCDDLCGSIREWLNSENTFLTSSWSSWLNIVHTYIRDKVTACNSIITKKIKYSNVEPLRAYIQDRNPAWIRPPGLGAAVLTATKLHQILRDEAHIVVSVTRLTQLQEKKVQCCWGPFCRWLVLVDDAEGSCSIQHHIMKHVGIERRLIIVSRERDDSFLDTFKSDDICGDAWKELINVEIRLNSEQYSCRLGDLCDTEALKTMLGENPEALAALSQLTGPVRMGQDLDPLPNNHVDRRLISRMHVREEFFSKLGVYDVCIMDKLSYNHLTNVSVNKTVEFEELENYLRASNAVWPLFSVTDIIDLHVIQMVCSSFQNMCVYVLSYEEDGWKILFIHRGSAKILPYVKEQSRSLWQIVDSLSRRIIVDGKPGIGKSTFLLDIANQVKRKNPSWWILRINLLTYSEVFNSYSSSFEVVTNILIRVVDIEKNVGILEYLLLQHCLKEYAHIICLVDGFDEICPNYAEKCLQALQQLTPRQGKLVVATRPSVTDCLEAAMGVLAHSLPSFTEEEVHRFHEGGDSKLDVTDSVIDLLKIPLFSRMYAEALESGVVVDDIVSLYETFFEWKFRILHENKCCNDLSKPGNMIMFERERKDQENHLGFLAVSHLLPKLEILCTAQPPPIDSYEIERAGFIYQFIDNKPVFIHRTFAEYFLAKWCWSNFGKEHCAKVYQTALSDNSLEFFVESFDRMASRGRPLLTAVVNGSESEVEALLQEGADPRDRDEMGRNSLHLVAAYSHESTLLWPLVNHLEVAGAERVGGSASGPAEETQEPENEVVVYEKGEKARLTGNDRASQCVQVTSDLGLAEDSGAAGLWAVAATDPVSAALGAEDALLQWTPLRYAAERRRWGAVKALLEAGAQPRHLGDFQRGLHQPQQLWRVFKEGGYRALVEHVKSENDWWNSKIQVAVSIVCAEMSPQQYKEICLEAIRHYEWEVAGLLHLKIVEMQNKSTSSGCPELELNQGATLKRRHEAGLGNSKKLENKRMGSTEERQTAAEDEEGWTELQRAVAAGDAAGARRLLEAGADVNMRDKRGSTAMHLAALAGCVHCVKLLISAGAALNVRDMAGRTALHAAARLGRRQAVRLLLDAGADAGAQDWRRETPLHEAVSRGNAECVRLMARAVESLEVKDKDGDTALHVAAGSGRVASVRLLLAAGADTSAENSHLWTPLRCAAQWGHPECVRLLLQAGAGVAAKDKWRGVTALHWALQSDNPDCVRLLLEAGADVQEKDEYGDTPLHRAAREGRAACMRLLLREGADVRQRNSRGETPLHCAARRGDAESVGLLLEAGARVAAKDMRGETALHEAARSRSPECVRLLLEAGAGVREKNENGDTPLHQAALYRRAACIAVLLRGGADVHQRNSRGQTPLHWAACEGEAECVRLLLDAGADIQETDEDGSTPLHWAARAGRAACIRLLLQEGADVHQRNNRGETPLHWAAWRGRAESVRLLLDAGADALARDCGGETPLQVAARCKREACLTLLNSAVADRQRATS